MELITNILIEYLKHNKRIVVPKLGVFIVKQPSGIIRFSDLMRNDDGVLKSLLMAYGVKELEATGMISRFVFEIRHAISEGKSYTIERLGEFTPSENNTITFKYKHEPIVFGGNIKPPIVTLDIEKQRLLRKQGRQWTPTPVINNEGRKNPHGGKKRGRKTEEENSTITLGRPDAYLRGLKYDKDKKKRGDDRNDGKRQRGLHPILIIMLILLATAGLMWALWRWIDGTVVSNAEYVIPIEESRPLVQDTTLLNEVDTTQIMSTDTTYVGRSDSRSTTYDIRGTIGSLSTGATDITSSITE